MLSISTITIVPNLTPNPRQTCLQLWVVAFVVVFQVPAAQLIVRICQMGLGAEVAAGVSRFGYLHRPIAEHEFPINVLEVTDFHWLSLIHI